jgi:hypothetical protein
MREPLILTFTGKHLNPLNIQAEDVCIEDVAHHLSIINRFNGCTARPISVAQHVVYVSRLLDGTGFEWQGLHHDDGEAYCGDVTKWLKMSDAMKGFRDAEDIAQRACYKAFNIEPGEFEGYDNLMHPRVGAADKLMVRFEGTKGYGIKVWKRWSDTITGYPMPTPEEIAEVGPWAPWPAKTAERLFLDHYRMLLGRGFGVRAVV